MSCNTLYDVTNVIDRCREQLIEKPFLACRYLLTRINPEARIGEDGWTFHCFTLFFRAKAHEICDSAHSTSFDKHFKTRACYVMEFVIGIPLRVIDVAIGILATLGAFLTLGRYDRVNRLACCGWMALGGIPGDCLRLVSRLAFPRTDKYTALYDTRSFFGKSRY